MAVPGGRTHKPKPFQRPGITLTEHGAKKHWVRTDPTLLQIGDIIRGHGLIVSGRAFVRPDVHPRTAEAWMVFTMKNGTEYRVDIQDRIVAFTEAEGEPIG